jgi:hypothetical protein
MGQNKDGSVSEVRDTAGRSWQQFKPGFYTPAGAVEQPRQQASVRLTRPSPCPLKDKKN